MVEQQIQEYEADVRCSVWVFRSLNVADVTIDFCEVIYGNR